MSDPSECSGELLIVLALMYLNGARMDGSYPASIVLDGVAMNITLSTYDRNVDFGIIACRRSMPQVQRLIDYMENALAELEQVVGIGSGRKKRTRGTGAGKVRPKLKAAASAKAKAKPKAKAHDKNESQPVAGNCGLCQCAVTRYWPAADACL